MSRPRLTQQQRDQRRDAQRQQLQSAVEALLSSDGWARWVRVRATNGLGRYSYNNQLLIAAQTGGQATYVCGFRRWQQLGFAVRKGEKAIWILAPHVSKRNDAAPRSEDDREERRLYFRAVPVFDRAAVDPIPGVEQAQLHPPQEPLSGDSHAHLLEPLDAFAGELGYEVAFQEIPADRGGWCDAAAKQIVVDEAQAPNAQVRILTHELAHALGVRYAQYGRGRAEVIVDCVTLVVLGGVGLDVSGESIPYIAGWGEDGAIEAVSSFAQTIDKVARQLEDALADPDGGLDDNKPSAAVPAHAPLPLAA